jgi:hypothetical protein
MKVIIALSGLLLSSSVYSYSCKTTENGVQTICNEYSGSESSAKLKKICDAGNFGTTKSTFTKSKCDQTNLIAKCIVKSKKVKTFYYKGNDLSAEQLEKGCKFFKDAVFTNIAAKSNPTAGRNMESMMKALNSNPKMKKYMDCVKKAKGADSIAQCRSILTK